jgi:hypothetical protein
VGNICPILLMSSVLNMGLFMRGHRHTHLNSMGLPRGKPHSNRVGECHVRHCGIIQGMVG